MKMRMWSARSSRRAEVNRVAAAWAVGVMLVGIGAPGAAPAIAASADRQGQGRIDPVRQTEQAAQGEQAARTDEADEAGDSDESPLSVVIKDQTEVLTPGDEVEYKISLRNLGDDEFPLAVLNQLLPQWLDYRSASPEPVAAEPDRLRWTVTVPAGDVVRLTVRGTVADDVPTDQWGLFGDPTERQQQFATTACVATDADGQIVHCATTNDVVSPSTPWFATLYAAIGYALFLVALIVGLLLWLRHRRNRRDPARTPEPAASAAS